MTIHPFIDAIRQIDPFVRSGTVRRVFAGRVVATGPYSTVGDLCEIGSAASLAQVVAVEDDHIVLVPLDATCVVHPDDTVRLRSSSRQAVVGDQFAGRAVDGAIHPIDSGERIYSSEVLPLDGEMIAPLGRQEPDAVLETGLRVIDGLLPVGRGQRIGILAASGVGKTTLVQQLAEQVECDRCVLSLVGERGREVEAMWRALSRSQDVKRFSCVAATSDVSAALRVRAVKQALCLAEHWRSKGEHVLLIMDSVTRYAMALREIGLAAGEPPTLRAYTPNVFAELPRIVERCGALTGGGSITAVFTVLSETDDVDDPIVETMKSLLDGHIVLSRHLAEQGHFPAIDVPKSVSRLSNQISSSNHIQLARRAKSQLAVYEESRVMIESGLYKPGASAEIDEAVKLRPQLLDFLQQSSTSRSQFDSTLNRLRAAVGRGRAHG